ncbi:serine/threonine-protein kinase BLUS1 isoform X1 [Impatiens glandulifera]|uniref:serine/threonine-protein kinase BLUS1 isoform X1 n=1 Tax=Impatiens glandulifera TaxID=253017 RepID=UPI001FB173B0|nr:serine/threonine-protein kinase BLUS1 isoform X1 [Impatiens glandulifera]
MENMPEKKFPVDAKQYKLYEEVGEGVSATVYRALCIPLNEIVAIKVLDLEKCNNDLDGIRREVQTMSLINQSNLLRAHCSFATGYHLWVVMPYMAGGSCLHIIKSAYPEGLEEPVIATLLREVLKSLVYLHAHGHIHRDVKAGNILLDSNGAVKLADFGVSACMFDTGDRQRSRNTFVGTPCWMAPEVMQQLHGYDFKADIWSFGITALELAHGHAPFSKYPPMKVLLMTLQNAPPGLDYERDKRFSKSFKELVAACLVKDPKRRPSSEKLLKHSFFKHARSTDYLARTILDGLAPLGERFRILQAKEANFLEQNKALYEDKEHLSQQEYIRGISAWDFNLEDLKSRAALIQDDDVISNAPDSSLRGSQKDVDDNFSLPEEELVPRKENHSNATPQENDKINILNNFDSSLAAFPLKPLQALKGCFDIYEDEEDATKSGSKESVHPNSEQQDQPQTSTKAAPGKGVGDDGETLGQSNSFQRSMIYGHKKYLSSPLLQDNILSPKKVGGEGEREHLQPRYPPDRNLSGPLLYRQKKDTVEETSEGAVVQRKGRFKVTAAELSPKIPATLSSNTVSGGSSSLVTPSISAASVFPSLQFILQQNTTQRDEILRLMKFVDQMSGAPMESTEVPSISNKEKELQVQMIQLQQSVGILVEELQRQKEKNAQMEKKLDALKREKDISTF